MTNTEILLADGYTAFGRTVFDESNQDHNTQDGLKRMQGEDGQGIKFFKDDAIMSAKSEPAFYPMINAGWSFPEDVGFSGYKIVGQHLSTVFETSWYHSIQLSEPRTHIGGPFRAAVADYHLGMCAIFQQKKFCPMTKFEITYRLPVKVGEVLETLQTDIESDKENFKLIQHGIQRVYGSDKIVGKIRTEHKYPRK